MSEEPPLLKLTREELYERVWATPLARLAEEFNISDAALAKRCRRPLIPQCECAVSHLRPHTPGPSFAFEAMLPAK
jgi:hypothetical protein